MEKNSSNSICVAFLLFATTKFLHHEMAHPFIHTASQPVSQSVHSEMKFLKQIYSFCVLPAISQNDDRQM
jgi:hypothetical protein